MGNMSDSKMLNYVNRKGWLFKQSGDEQIAIEFCPYCSHNNFKLYANISGAEKDGLHDCKVCGVKGNLTSLMKQQGDIVEGLTSFKDSMNNVAINMPPVDKFNKALMEDEDALDYLVHDRGFTLSVIEKYKLGLDITENGEKWISIPYFHKDNLVFVKWRSLPPAEKKFRGIKGREAPLFNQDVIKNEMPELIFVEGEADCLSCLSNGIEAVVGVPGANVQKTTWIKRVDDANISKIYICYDSDSVGQKAAKELAHKIGLDKTFNIVLPSFTTTDGKVGKDINEWFVAGNNLRDFDILKEQSRPFDVEGVINVETALDELDASFMGGSTLQPALDTPWPSLTRRMGGCEWGDLVGIIAEGKIGKTSLALNWLSYYTYVCNINTLMFCLEMSPKRMVRKWVSHVTHTDDTPGRSQITQASIQEARKLAMDSESEMLFGWLPGATKETTFDLIRQAVRRYGVKVVCFDNLQYLARSITHQTAELGTLSKGFKDLAQELGIVILLIIQPNRVRDGDIVSAKNSNGSSAIEKDVDTMATLHRNRIAQLRQEDLVGIIETEDNFEPMLYGRIDLSRYAPGGSFTLYMEGATSTIREVSDAEKVGMPKINFGSSIQVEA
jgi:5S rRNA maturation endonuclease (ribonuclease M5)